MVTKASMTCKPLDLARQFHLWQFTKETTQDVHRDAGTRMLLTAMLVAAKKQDGAIKNVVKEFTLVDGRKHVLQCVQHKSVVFF